MKLGDTVTCTAILKRRGRALRGWSAEKFWENCTIQPRRAVFLGLRTLSNGRRDVEDEVGYIYEPREYFSAALVCFSARENPVYVPLAALTEVSL